MNNLMVLLSMLFLDIVFISFNSLSLPLTRNISLSKPLLNVSTI